MLAILLELYTLASVNVAIAFPVEYESVVNVNATGLVLNVDWLLETAVFTELESYFYDTYRHAQERYKQWEKWITYQKLLTNLEKCMEAIEDELGIRRDLWLDNFYAVESTKQISDTQAIDAWIENKMDIFRFHMVDLYT